MSFTRSSQSCGTRLPPHENGKEVITRGSNKTGMLQPILPGIEKLRAEQEQMTGNAWATRIKDVTSRLSRPTISSSLKRVNMVGTQTDIVRNSQFWNMMTYCSNEYSRKFTNDTSKTSSHHVVPGLKSLARINNGGFVRNKPAPSWSTSHNTGSTLPALGNEHSTAPRR